MSSDLVYEVQGLTDEDLAEKLRDLGYSPGPIVASTRSVYQRKLIKLLRGEGDSEDMVMGDDTFSSSQIDPSELSYATSPYSRYDDLRRRPLPRAESSWDPIPVSSPFRSVSQSHLTANSAPSKSSVSPKVKIVCLAVVLLFAFFVYYNLESSASNPVPEG